MNSINNVTNIKSKDKKKSKHDQYSKVKEDYQRTFSLNSGKASVWGFGAD